jgi:predicted nucleic acid-binding protein
VRIALDTNVLAYAEGIGDQTRRDSTLRLLELLPVNDILLPAQTIGELYRVLNGKALRDPGKSREAILSWADTYYVADSSWSAFQSAMDLAVDHRLQIWDALIMAIAAEHNCRILLSEDLQHGFTWRGLSVVNPYADTIHPLLERALNASPS